MTTEFFRGSERGRKESKVFELNGNPTKVRLFMGDSDDGWGFREVEIFSADRKVSCILASGKGAEYGDNPWWLDTDGNAPMQRIFPMAHCQRLCP